MAHQSIFENNTLIASSKNNDIIGSPIQILIAKEDHTFILDESAIEKILLKPNVRDKKVVVVSIAGAFRKGKSFFLDFCLRYLHAKGSSNWLGGDEEPLIGFPWKGGADKYTTGIVMWSEPFIVYLPALAEEVAVLLMDTQGVFDSTSTVKDCATIFALSQLISSVQVYNIMMNVQEDDLQHLQLFTEYGRLAMEDNSAKPFQDLYFFVRDWQYGYEYEYGDDGGAAFIEKRLEIKDGQHKELQQLRKHIRSCFNKIQCYLMPHPGLKVSTNLHFDGKLSDISDDFKEHLKIFVPNLLSRHTLIVKQINGQKILCRELLEYFKVYVKMYQGDELPEPKSMLQATAEANNLSAVSIAKDLYMSGMEKICGGDHPYVSIQILEDHHNRCCDTAFSSFDSIRKMGGPEFSLTYRSTLKEKIDELYKSYQSNNKSKDVMAAMKTPAIIFSVFIVFYFASGLLGMCGVYSLAYISNLFMLVALGLLSIWIYSRYTGLYRDISQIVDDLAAALWDYVFGPIWLKILQDNAINNSLKRN